MSSTPLDASTTHAFHRPTIGSFVEITCDARALDASGAERSLARARGFIDAIVSRDQDGDVNEVVIALDDDETYATVALSDTKVVRDEDVASDDEKARSARAVEELREMFAPPEKVPRTKKEMEGVLNAAKKAVKAHPTSVVANYVRGEAYHYVGESQGERGAFKDEVKHKQRALAAVGQKIGDGVSKDLDVALRINMANAYGYAGYASEELALVREVLKEYPGHLSARWMLGNIYTQNKQFGDAVVQYMMVRDLPNDAPMQVVVTKEGEMYGAPAPDVIVEMMRKKSKDAIKRVLIEETHQLVKRKEYGTALQTLAQVYTTHHETLDASLEPVDRAKFMISLLTCLARVGCVPEAYEIMSTEMEKYAKPEEEGVLKHLPKPIVSWVFTNFGHVCEAAADDERDSRFDVECGEVSKDLYEEAKTHYKLANAIQSDQTSREGFMRVQMKANPKFLWIPGPDVGSAAVNTGGSAKCIAEGAMVDRL